MKITKHAAIPHDCRNVTILTGKDRLFARGDEIELSFCNNGYQSTSVSLDPDMLFALRNLIEDYHNNY